MHSPASQIIPTEMLLLAYRSGVFPMADGREEDDLFWVEPRERAVIPLDGFHCSRSLARTLRQDRFSVTCNRDFPAVIRACAQPRPGHPDTWINQRIEDSYIALHKAGHAHSLECWQEGSLVGGLYGVSFDLAFCGESMFSRATDASKVALAWLIVLLRKAGYRLLDCQFITDHLASLGATRISRADYLELLSHATADHEAADLPGAYEALLAEAGAFSPGKLIAQSLTQTS